MFHLSSSTKKHFIFLLVWGSILLKTKHCIFHTRTKLFLKSIFSSVLDILLNLAYQHTLFTEEWGFPLHWLWKLAVSLGNDF